MPMTEQERQSLYERVEALYEQKIRPLVETDENVGKIIMIDPASGDYEISDNSLDSVDRLKARHPETTPVAFRIGYDAVYGFGGGPRRTKQ